MEEKKLTDEEVIKAFELCRDWEQGTCAKCPLNGLHEAFTLGCDKVRARYILDIFNRQKAEIESLKKDYIELDLECRELRTYLDKELDEHEEFTKTAKAEIERLASVNMQTIGKNADLQMKVDEYYQRAFVYYKKCKAYGMDFKDEEFEIQAKDGKVFKMPKFTTNEEEVE